MEMSGQKTCLNCGAALPADAPRGLCPVCLARAAVGDWLEASANHRGSARAFLHYFGDYELEEEIARGGMGVVYRARQVSLNRRVAVKMILAGQFANPADLKRFQAEAEAAARLSHPNIVDIYEVGEHEGQHYFSMRLVEGASLAGRMQKAQCQSQNDQAPKPLRAADSARITAKVARAVHFAHQHGVLHRDLKPGNILIDNRGEPHIADFGLAKLIESESDLTLSGAVLGSPGYLAPEQAAGKTSHLTTAVDVYGLGAVLYFLLAGQAPFTGATAVEILRRVVDEEPPRPRAINPRVDADLETICLKCLEKDPQRRYGSAEALAEDLERWLRDEPILARPVGKLEHVRKWIRREPRLAVSVGIALLLLVSGVAGVVWEWRQAAAAQREAIEKLRDSYLAQAHANRLTAEPGRRFRSLEILAKAAAIRPGPDLRDEAIACLALTDVRCIKTAPDLAAEGGCSQPDSAWERYAAALPSGEISVRRLSDDREIVRLATVGVMPDEFIGFSHSGRWLAVLYRDGPGRVWDLERKAIAVAESMPHLRQAVDFRPGDQHLALANDKGTVLIFETKTGKRLHSFTTETSSKLLAYSPDGKWLAVAEDNGRAETRVRVLTAESGTSVASLVHPQALTGLGWHPDSRRLVTTCYDRQVRLWDVLAAKELLLLAGHGEELSGAAFHPGGELLLSAGFDGAMLWEVQTGKRLFALPGSRLNPKFAASGDRFYTRNLSVKGFDLWAISADVPVRSMGFKEPLSGVKAVTFSPDGRLLVFADGQRLVCLDPTTGRDSSQLEFGEAASLHLDAQSQLWASYPLWGTGQFAVRRCSLRPGLAEGEWSLSSPRPALEAGMMGEPALSGGGRWLAVPYRDHCRVLETATSREVARTPGQFPTSHCAFSPDNRWLATGARRYGQVHLWRFSAGQTNLLKGPILQGESSWGGVPQFSADGRRLAVHWGVRVVMYDTADWGQLWSHPVEDHPVFAFAPNGQLLALRTDKHHFHLLAPHDGTRLATLEIPGSLPVEALAFSPDSTLLAAANSSTRELFVWDLPAVRRELARLGLDWQVPAEAESHPAEDGAHR